MDELNTSNSTSHPSLVEHLIAAAVTLLILEQHSRFPEANVFIVGIASLTTLLLAIVYCTRLVMRSLSQVKPSNASRRTILHWVVFPTAVALMFTSAATHWPATIRFYLSKSSFDELVSQAYNGQEPQGFPRRVGLYWIDYVQDDAFDYETRQGTIGFVTGVVLIDECGLYYDKADRRSSHYLTTRIAPRWYITEW